MSTEKTRICAMSDMHGNIDGIDVHGNDIVIIAGDSAPLNGFGKWDLYRQRKWFINKMIPWILSYPKTLFVIIPGNHDMSLDITKTSLYHGMEWRIDWPKNAHLLIDLSITLFGLKIYGTPWVPIISYHWAFEAEHDELQKHFSKIPNDIDILITHTPPHISNSSIDRSNQYGGIEAFGSSELTQEIFDKKPRYLFCGHIHSGLHDCVMFENCMCYNVSRVDETYQIAYDPLIIKILHKF